MLSKPMQDAFNRQINAETYSAYLYWSMSAMCEQWSLGGFANWLRIQAQEEMVHAMKFYTHIIDRGGKVELAAIDGPPKEWASVHECFQGAYGHEQKISGMINDLYELAQKEKDFASIPLLQWFVDEQVEEEKSADDVVQKLKMVSEAKGGIYMLDKEMSQRVFNPPAQEGE